MVGMRRREFIGLCGGAAAWPLAARAQQPERMRRIGALIGFAETDSYGQASANAFLAHWAYAPGLLGLRKRTDGPMQAQLNET